jgi:hypothetical protein
MSDRIEHSDGGLEYRLIVIDDQDTPFALHLRGLLRTDRLTSAIAHSYLSARQVDLHGGALADTGLDSHSAARLFGETENLSQSEA